MNTIIICITIYCAICALIIVLVPVVRKTWKPCIKVLSSELNRDRFSWTFKRILLFKKILYVIFFVLFYMIGMCIIFLLTPFIIPLFVKYERNRVRKLSETETVERENNLYFSHLGGAGTILCADCGHKEEGIISFLHGFDAKGMCDGSSGYQCQSCGKFHTLDEVDERNKNFTCSCGGELRRDKTLFCPQCKSFNMRYEMDF